jgi:hypothetical protein
MAAILALSILLAALPLGALIVFGPGLLLGWYMREIRRVNIAEEPGEAIVTYPLA